MSEYTKGYKIKSRITFWLSLALNIIPMIVFFFCGFSVADVNQKVILSFTAVAAIVLGVIMAISKAKIGRSIFWIVFLVFYFCMQDMLPIIVAMGACTIVDELLVSPLHKRWNTDYHTNKQIDKRGVINDKEEHRED